MTTKCNASLFPPAYMPHPKEWRDINTSLEWAAMYQESVGLKDAAKQTRALIATHKDLIAKGVLK